MRKFRISIQLHDLRSNINDIAEEASDEDAEVKLNGTITEIFEKYVTAGDEIDFMVDIDANTLTLLEKEKP